jgi:hypothetical protein
VKFVVPVNGLNPLDEVKVVVEVLMVSVASAVTVSDKFVVPVVWAFTEQTARENSRTARQTAYLLELFCLAMMSLSAFLIKR